MTKGSIRLARAGLAAAIGLSAFAAAAGQAAAQPYYGRGHSATTWRCDARGVRCARYRCDWRGCVRTGPWRYQGHRGYRGYNRGYDYGGYHRGYRGRMVCDWRGVCYRRW